eukprot:Selendium_serpulae@DN6005_c0_g1_i2.p1
MSQLRLLSDDPKMRSASMENPLRYHGASLTRKQTDVQATRAQREADSRRPMQEEEEQYMVSRRQEAEAQREQRRQLMRTPDASKPDTASRLCTLFRRASCHRTCSGSRYVTGPSRSPSPSPPPTPLGREKAASHKRHATSPSPPPSQAKRAFLHPCSSEETAPGSAAGSPRRLEDVLFDSHGERVPVWMYRRHTQLVNAAEYHAVDEEEGRATVIARRAASERRSVD